jgi:hypothetical protein
VALPPTAGLPLVALPAALPGVPAVPSGVVPPVPLLATGGFSLDAGLDVSVAHAAINPQLRSPI